MPTLVLLASLYCAQGLPSGLIAHSLPVLLRQHGVDLAVIGVLKLLALPWMLKVLWAPWVQPHRLGTSRSSSRLDTAAADDRHPLCRQPRPDQPGNLVHGSVAAAARPDPAHQHGCLHPGHRHRRPHRAPAVRARSRSRQQPAGRRLQGRHDHQRQRSPDRHRPAWLESQSRLDHLVAAAVHGADLAFSRTAADSAPGNGSRKRPWTAPAADPLPRPAGAAGNARLAGGGPDFQARRCAGVADDQTDAGRSGLDQYRPRRTDPDQQHCRHRWRRIGRRALRAAGRPALVADLRQPAGRGHRIDGFAGECGGRHRPGLSGRPRRANRRRHVLRSPCSRS